MQNPFQMQAQAAMYGGVGVLQHQMAAMQQLQQQQQVQSVRPPLPPLPPGPPPPESNKSDVANIPTPAAASEPPPLPPGPPGPPRPSGPPVPPGPPPHIENSQNYQSQSPQGQQIQWGQHFQSFRGPRPPPSNNQQGGQRPWGPRPPMNQERGPRGPRPQMNQHQRGPRPLMDGGGPHSGNWNQQQRGPRPMMNQGGPRPLMDTRLPRQDFQQQNQGNNRGGHQDRNQQQNQGRNNRGGSEDRREGDWTCPQCSKLNFSFRNNCKWCPNVTKPSQEDHDANFQPRDNFQGNQRFGNQNQPQRKSRFESNQDQDQRRFGQDFGGQERGFDRQGRGGGQQQQNNRNNQQNPNLIERPADWICKIDGTNNFAKRKSCFKCSRPRDQCEYFENQQQQQQHPQPSRSQQQQQTPQPPKPVTKTQDSPNKTDLAQFEQMFSNWEKQFEEWKVTNADNPDQKYVRDYITNMNAMKEKLEERRRNLQLKNQQVTPAVPVVQAQAQPAYYTASSSSSSTSAAVASSSKPSTSQPESSISDIVKAALENSQFGLNPDSSKVPPMTNVSASEPKQMPEEITLEEDDEEENPLFSKRTEGIPGIGDGQDPEIVIEEEPFKDPHKPRIDISDPEAEDDEEIEEIPPKRTKVDEELDQDNRWGNQQPSQYQSRRPGACWTTTTQQRPQRPSFTPRFNQPALQRPFMPRSGTPMQPRFARPPMQRPNFSNFPRPQRPDFAPRNSASWNTRAPSPAAIPKSAWDERNELFMNPDDDDVDEEDLFERRDNSSKTWNPVAKVVDYAHGGQESASSKDYHQDFHDHRNHDQRPQQYNREYHHDDHRRFYENERREHHGQDHHLSRSYDRNDQYYDHHSRGSSYDREFRGGQDHHHTPRNYNQYDDQPTQPLRPAPKAFTEPKAPPAEPQKAPQGDILQVDDLVHPPGRYMRPPKIVIILRGLPGSGKSFVAKNIKNQESSYGSEAPRILALDDYFECDGEYEYEAELEDAYRASLIKSFKKQIDDGYFSFIMVDCINNLNKHYEEMWSYAKQKGFEVSIFDDVTICFAL